MVVSFWIFVVEFFEITVTVNSPIEYLVIDELRLIFSPIVTSSSKLACIIESKSIIEKFFVSFSSTLISYVSSTLPLL